MKPPIKRLESLHQAGVRGIRCNIVDVADPCAGLPIENLRATRKQN
jgi:hypothetical protein